MLNLSFYGSRELWSSLPGGQLASSACLISRIDVFPTPLFSFDTSPKIAAAQQKDIFYNTVAWCVSCAPYLSCLADKDGLLLPFLSMLVVVFLFVGFWVLCLFVCCFKTEMT